MFGETLDMRRLAPRVRGGVPVLLLLLLIAVPSTTAAGDASTVGESQDEAVLRCFSLRSGNPAAAVDLAKSILGAASLTVENEIKALACLGRAEGMVGNTQAAIDAAVRVQQRLDEHPMPNDFALRALSNAGSSLHVAGEISRAEALYLKAYKLAEAEDLAVAQSVMLNNVATIQSEYLDAPELADHYYRQAIALSREDDGGDRNVLFYNFAANLIRLGRDDEAAVALDQAMAIAQRTNSTMFIDRLKSERATLLRKQGQFVQAQALLTEAIASQRQLPDPEGEALSLAKLSVLQREQGNVLAALDGAQAAVRLVDGSSFRGALVDSLRALAAAHAAAGQVDAAMQTAERVHGLQMSSLRDYERSSLAGLQARLQDAAGASELERLRHEQALGALRADRARLVRNWVSGVALLLCVGGLTFSVMTRRLNHRLKVLSTVDVLTGLLNRRAATESLMECSGAPEANGVLMLIDIDKFKSINDRFGHDAGDRALRELAARLRKACRPDDLLARWGGEEFLVACKNLDAQQASALAERLRLAASRWPIDVSEKHRIQLTISIGFAPYPFFSDPHRTAVEPISWQDVTRIADRALYAAKRSGRNAWAGLWGRASTKNVTIETLLDDPVDAESKGQIEILSSRPITWSVLPKDVAGEQSRPVLAAIPVRALQ